MTKRSKRRYAKAAAKAPTWLRTGVIAKDDNNPNKWKQHKKRKLGTFGAASECRQLTPEEIAELNGKT